MGFALAIFLSALIICFCRWYLQRRKFVQRLEKFPGPPPLPLVGNALELSSTTALLPKLMEYSQKYGDVVKLYIGPTPAMLLITDYNMIEFILGSTKIIEKASQYQFLASWLGNGLLLSGGEKWRQHRKIITLTFHFKILEKFIEVFESNAKILIEKLNKEAERPSVDVHPFIKLCLLDIICETAMGTSIDAQNNSQSEYVRSIQVMCQVLVARTFGAFMQHKFFYAFSKLYQMETKAVKFLNDYTDSVIKKRKSELSSNPKVADNDVMVSIKKRLAFLDMLLQEKATNRTLTDKDIREEVATFLFGGHDSTSSALCFILHCLAENPEEQDKAVKELQKILADDKFRPVTLKDLQDMKYMELVIKESLRIYPPIPIYSRNCHEDIEYEGAIIPKDITLIINAYGMHRKPEFYPEPEKFNPERFSVENSNTRPSFAYLPFSAGPRNCVGQRFAMLQMKTVLSAILKKYKILPANPKHNLMLSLEGILVSSNGVHVCLEERDF